jgi:hypothetical protein
MLKFTVAESRRSELSVAEPAKSFRAKLTATRVYRQRQGDIHPAFRVFAVSTKDLRQVDLAAKDLRFESETKGSVPNPEGSAR